MATPFSNVYSRFLRKITDHRLASLDTASMEDRIYGWMESAIPKFSKCHTNLADRDQTTKEFRSVLSDAEQEILSHLMVVEWLEPEVKSIMDMQNVFYNNDWKTYSTANLLKEKNDLLGDAIARADQLIVSYTFDTMDFSQFGS